MNHMDTEEATSSDDTTIISELLNSSEAMQSLVNSNPLQQRDDLLSVQDNSNKQNITMLPLTNFGDKELSIDGGNDNKHNLGSQCAEIGDINKMEHLRHVHIPYILNGELYQIQTQDGENVTVKCCHCPPDRVYRGSVRSTGNFHMHIKRRHPDLLEKLHNMKVSALLERRDRLIRNRKINHRTNRSRLSAIVNQNSIGTNCSFKSEDRSSVLVASADTQILLDSSPELSLMHSHNLKIKTVFQRHQMQQREAEMRNWNNNADNVVMPIDKLTNEEQPINYSLKSQENNEILTAKSSYSNVNQLPSQHQKSQHPQHDEQRKEQNISQSSCINLTNSNAQTISLTNADIEKNQFVCERNARGKNLSISTSSISISCPSVLSNFSSNHQYDTETDQQYNNDTPGKHRHLFIVKPEHLLSTENEAIDLSMHTDSGIFSNFDDDVVDQNNNGQSIRKNNSNNRTGSRKTNDCSTTTIHAIHNTDTNNSNNKNTCNNSLKWQEVLMRVETSLRDIQREMNVRNQIESNRIFLDIAKFKFLHPGFQFN